MKRKTAWILIIAMLTVFLFNGMKWWDFTVLSDIAFAAGQNTISQYLDMNELTGFATLDGAGSQKLEGGVTGGNNGEVVTVTTDDAFVNAVSDDTPRVVVVSGSIRAIDSGGYAINVGSNKTIVGADKNAVLKGGININSKSNIIVSNLTFEGNWISGDSPESRTPDDCINVENSHHIWFNHLNIHDAADGNLDIKVGSNYITVSWCKFWYTNSKNNHRLSCLIGSGAGDHDDTDYGRLKVTYHHNWFADLCDQRMPRVMYGMVHVYNNYYTCTGNSYCIGAGCYATVLVENNYFKNVTNPHEFSDPQQTYPCAITARGNQYDGTSGKKDSGQHPKASSDATPFENAPYPYLIDQAEDVPAIVEKHVGPQDIDPNATPVPKATPAPSAEPTPIPTAKPALTPVPTAKPSKNDNPPTYVEDGEKGEVLQFNGQNSDRTNGFIEIDNPFAGKDLSETPEFVDGYPTWTKGVSIAYWEYIPTGVSREAPVLNFSGTHRAVHFQDWPRLEDGTEDGYQNRYQDNGGTYSLVREGDVTSGLQITSLASFGYSEDDGSARDENPYSNSYGKNINNFQQKNYLYYFANKSGTRTALATEKGKWHFVTVVIRNDLIQTYVDGQICSTDCFNYYDHPITGDSRYSDKVNGEGFNMGYGWEVCRRVAFDTSYYRHSMPILEFLSLENTKLIIGGDATLWSSLGMNGYKTEKGIRLTDFSFYDVPLTSDQVQTLMNGTEPGVTPEPTSPVSYKLGDVDNDGFRSANDALLVLQSAARLVQLNDTELKAADVDGSGEADAEDALNILKMAAKLIDKFPIERKKLAPETTIPSKYTSSREDDGGSVVTFTYETRDYLGDQSVIEKDAYIYLPAGYDESKQYNVMYMMHGVGGTNNEWEIADQGSTIKKYLDNLIACGDIDPLIVVFPSGRSCENFNDTSNGGMNENMQAFYLFGQELRNDLIPSIDQHFATYGKYEPGYDLSEAREHRAMAGFSMGGMQTINIGLCECLDMISYFGAFSSAPTTYTAAQINQNLEQFSEYNISLFYNMCGTSDQVAFSSHQAAMNGLVEKSGGKLTENENFIWQKVEGAHTMNVWRLGFYNFVKMAF